MVDLEKETRSRMHGIYQAKQELDEELKNRMNRMYQEQIQKQRDLIIPYDTKDRYVDLIITYN